VSSEEVAKEFEWIPDPSLTRAMENLYTHVIDLSWQLKMLLDLAMQEQGEMSKVVEEKIDMLTEKFVVYVEPIHHCRFVTKESSHYTMLKKWATTGVRSPVEFSPNIKKEATSASSSDPMAPVV